MSSTIKTTLIIFFLCLFPQFSTAEDLSALQIAEKLQSKYDQTLSMSADFVQLTSSKMSRRKKQGSGSLLLLKPGKMRWDYTSPDQQVVVCDGESIRMYFSREKQMLISSAKQYLEADITYSFFAGTGNLVRDFEVGHPDDIYHVPGKGKPGHAIRIVPKENHPQLDFIILWTNEDFLVTRILVVDQFGSTTDIKLRNINLNTDIPESAFLFVPPEGTEIIEQ